MLDQIIYWTGAAVLIAAGVALAFALIAGMLWCAIEACWKQAKRVNGIFFVLAAIRQRRARERYRVAATNPVDGGNDTLRLDFLLDFGNEIYLYDPINRALPTPTRESIDRLRQEFVAANPEDKHYAA